MVVGFIKKLNNRTTEQRKDGTTERRNKETKLISLPIRGLSLRKKKDDSPLSIVKFLSNKVTKIFSLLIGKFFVFQRNKNNLPFHWSEVCPKNKNILPSHW